MLDFIQDKTLVLQICKIITSGFLAILFTQSALDKIFDWKGNLDFTEVHFENTFLKGMAKPMLLNLTLLELTSAALTLAGTFELLIDPAGHIAFLGYLACCIAFLALLLGQRIAKDYAGAAVLPSYFLIAVVGLLLYS